MPIGNVLKTAIQSLTVTDLGNDFFDPAQPSLMGSSLSLGSLAGTQPPTGKDVCVQLHWVLENSPIEIRPYLEFRWNGCFFGARIYDKDGGALVHEVGPQLVTSRVDGEAAYGPTLHELGKRVTRRIALAIRNKLS